MFCMAFFRPLYCANNILRTNRCGFINILLLENFSLRDHRTAIFGLHSEPTLRRAQWFCFLQFASGMYGPIAMLKIYSSTAFSAHLMLQTTARINMSPQLQSFFRFQHHRMLCHTVQIQQQPFDGDQFGPARLFNMLPNRICSYTQIIAILYRDIHKAADNAVILPPLFFTETIFVIISSCRVAIHGSIHILWFNLLVVLYQSFDDPLLSPIYSICLPY